MSYTPVAPGYHDLFVRFKGLKPQIYPLRLWAFFTLAASAFSDIVNIPALSPQVVGIPLIFDVVLRDS